MTDYLYEEELIKSAKPLSEFLSKHYNPMTYAIVTNIGVEIVRSEAKMFTDDNYILKDDSYV